MALTEAEIRQQTTGLDRAFVLAVIKIQSEVEGITLEAAKVMAARVLKYASSQGVKDQDSLIADLIGFLGLYFAFLDRAILDGQVDIARVKVATAKKQYIAPLNKAKAYKEAKKLTTELNNFPIFVQRTFAYRKSGSDNQTYQGRIKSIQEGAERTVRNIVANGVESGQSALQISKKIEQYISPAASGPRTRPYDEYRKRFDTKATPKNIRAGSVRTNALMIARTETAEMYRDATEKLYRNKSWIKGYRWVLSNSHPTHDVCDGLASNGLYPKDGIRPFSHPHCVCQWNAERYTDAELDRMVKDGKLS